jgi:hypothetical protein
MKKSVRRIIGSAAELKVSSASLKQAVRLGDTEKIKRQFRRLRRRIADAQQRKLSYRRGTLQRCLKSNPPGFDTGRDLFEDNGGRVVLFRALGIPAAGP